MQTTYKTIKELHEKIKKGEITSTELVKNSLARIKKLNKDYNMFTSVFEKDALKQAEEIDKRIKEKNKITELTGVPYAVKANYASKGQRASASSRLLDKYKSPYDATIIKRLKKAGAILIGKTNCDAYGFGVSTENSGYGPTRNPWDYTRIAGGSSGGGAAAVASGCVPFAMLEDTGGSIRQPSSLCGVVGLKPSYGLLSRYGVFAMACSYDCPGPVARSTEDIAIILNHITGKDKKDSQTIELKEKNYLWKNDTKKDFVIGYPKQFMNNDVDKGTIDLFKKRITELKDKGYKVKELNMSYLKHAAEVYFILVPGEISSNMALYDGVRFARSKNITGENGYKEVYIKTKSEGWEEEVKRRVMIGTFALSSESYKEYYEKAAKVRTLIIKDFERAFCEVDFVVSPSSPEIAWNIGEKVDPVKNYLADFFSFPASNAGLPALSLPIGFDKDLPVGLQIIGKKFHEKEIFEFANDFEKKHDIKNKHPKV